MGGLHDMVMKVDPIGKRVHGDMASALGIEEDVEGDALGLSQEARDIKAQKQQDEIDKAQAKSLANRATMPIGKIKHVT